LVLAKHSGWLNVHFCMAMMRTNDIHTIGLLFSSLAVIAEIWQLTIKQFFTYALFVLAGTLKPGAVS
jgi:hypothetical protein